MRTQGSLVAVVSLILTVVFIPIDGGGSSRWRSSACSCSCWSVSSAGSRTARCASTAPPWTDRRGSLAPPLRRSGGVVWVLGGGLDFEHSGNVLVSPALETLDRNAVGGQLACDRSRVGAIVEGVMQ
jgi:hypothetical protein